MVIASFRALISLLSNTLLPLPMNLHMNFQVCYMAALLYRAKTLNPKP